MSELKPQPPRKSESTSIVGVVNFAHLSESVTTSYSSNSYTVAAVGSEQPSRPLSAATIRVVNSVLRARVRESAIMRETDGDM